jgi:hypothetical protein
LACDTAPPPGADLQCVDVAVVVVVVVVVVDVVVVGGVYDGWE